MKPRTLNRKTTTQKSVETDEQRQYRETVESIARNIASLTKAVAALLHGPLKKRALVVLLASSSGLSQAAVSQVLDALASMEKDWLQ